MQYLLTEDEYKALRDQASLFERQHEEVLKDLCARVANSEPVEATEHREAKPWGCVYTVKTEHYCDRCPVLKQCPRSKHFGK